VTQSNDFSGDPNELFTVAGRATDVSDELSQRVWKDEWVGDHWLEHGYGPDDEQLITAMIEYRRSLRAATSRLADRAERLGEDLRTSANAYSGADQASAGLLPRPDPRDE
jgi:hypothetical protein